MNESALASTETAVLRDYLRVECIFKPVFVVSVEEVRCWQLRDSPAELWKEAGAVLAGKDHSKDATVNAGLRVLTSIYFFGDSLGIDQFTVCLALIMHSELVL